MVANSQPLASSCTSCGRPPGGRFCSDCGEGQPDFHSLTVRHFRAHSLHEIFELDGKIRRTLRALLSRPGFLAAEYCAGRRRLHVNPFRLLITAAIVYELATSGGARIGMTLGPLVVSPAPSAGREGTSIAGTVERVDRFHLLRGLPAERERSAEAESEAAREEFHQRLEKFAEPLSFANVIVPAVALYVLFGRRRRHFVEHGVFSMHFMSFVPFAGLLFFPVPALMRAGWGRVVLLFILLILIWQFVFLVVAIRRFYFGSPISGIGPKLFAGFGATAMYFPNSGFITGVQTRGAALALWMSSSVERP
ncbi:MAG TPA: DUF3667 domain-containing protein [Candidatus Sulfopaludibacter sp.]|nr:DUF3667 domain-containing protein [Candidatus Sulfopaludibacter sp.]